MFDGKLNQGGNRGTGASVFDLSSPSKIDSKANRMLKNDPSLISIQGMSCESNSFFDGYKNGSIMMSIFLGSRGGKNPPDKLSPKNDQ